MTIRIGINGFGRIGRLALRAAWHWPHFDIVHVNEMAGDAKSAAHLLKYDSVHGTWEETATAAGEQTRQTLQINDKSIRYTQSQTIEGGDWSDVDVVIECTGKFKSQQLLAPFFAQGVKKVVVSAPIKDGTLNVVMGGQ